MGMGYVEEVVYWSLRVMSFGDARMISIVCCGVGVAQRYVRVRESRLPSTPGVGGMWDAA